MLTHLGDVRCHLNFISFLYDLISDLELDKKQDELYSHQSNPSKRSRFADHFLEVIGVC